MAEKNNTDNVRYDLVVDKKGMIWDLLLYIPTVVALASIGMSFWYGDSQNMGYLFFFLTSFFFIAGFNRVFKTRLMLLPSAPVAITVAQDRVELQQKNGTRVNLLKDVRYFSDYAGRTFGLSGLDGAGKQLQFVFHKGQFGSVEKYEAVSNALKNRYGKK